MKECYDVNEGFIRHIKNIAKVQKVSSTADVNLRNDATLLRLGVEAMHQCSLCDETLDEWTELSKSNKKWDVFQYYHSKIGSILNTTFM